MHGPAPQRRRYLFLQGNATSFFSRLARELAKGGNGIRRINFNGGDRLIWRLPGAIDYRGGTDDWPLFLHRQIRAWDITDIVLFGDCRPLHRAAIKIGNSLRIAVHVFEEGYIRPNWITLEEGGANGNSNLPHDPAYFRAAARPLAAWDGGTTVRASFLRRAIGDVSYNLATAALAWRYPNYRTHRPLNPLLEYLHGARRFLRKPLAKRHTREYLSKLIAEDREYYVFPLQLESDAQVRYHSQYKNMETAIETVVSSFSRHAPGDALLVVTEHPLDTSRKDWRQITRSAAVKYGVRDRVSLLEGGSPEKLIKHSRGVATINSTIGHLALNFGVPVVALGVAIYDLPGLTFQGGLDGFWQNGTPPKFEMFDAYRRVIAERTQINGGYFSAEGLSLAVLGAAKRLEGAYAVQPVGDKDYVYRVVMAEEARDTLHAAIELS